MKNFLNIFLVIILAVVSSCGEKAPLLIASGNESGIKEVSVEEVSTDEVVSCWTNKSSINNKSDRGSNKALKSNSLRKLMEDKLDPMTACYLNNIDPQFNSLDYFRPVILPAFNGREWKDSWSDTISETIENNPMLADDLLYNPKVISYDNLNSLDCLGFRYASGSERKLFWTVFISSMAYAESSFHPKTSYRESDGTDSLGLLQIDKRASNAYCSDSKAMGRKFGKTEMFDAETNLMCGIHIVHQQVTARRPVGIRKHGKGYLFAKKEFERDDPTYFAVTRESRKGSSKVKARFKLHMAQMPFCKRQKALPQDSVGINRCSVNELNSPCSEHLFLND